MKKEVEFEGIYRRGSVGFQTFLLPDGKELDLHSLLPDELVKLVSGVRAPGCKYKITIECELL